MLNSRAWTIAVSGGDAKEGLMLAEESVEAKAEANNLDTLAVLQYLAGDKEKAIMTLVKGLQAVDPKAAPMLRDRIDQLRRDELRLH